MIMHVPCQMVFLMHQIVSVTEDAAIQTSTHPPLWGLMAQSVQFPVKDFKKKPVQLVSVLEQLESQGSCQRALLWTGSSMKNQALL